MNIKNFRLMGDAQTPVTFDPSDNHSAGMQPRFLLMHYTGDDNLAGAVAWFKRPESKASAHFVIGRDGTVIQMVPLDRRAWHAGESRWKQFTSLNRHSIGIELVNAGRLIQRADGSFATALSARPVAATDVALLQHRLDASTSPWQLFPPEQIAAAVRVGQVLHEAFAFQDILGHDDIAPERKRDPGPAFPMGAFRSMVLGRQ